MLQLILSMIVGAEQHKARNIEMDTSLQRAERLEVLSKTKEDLRLRKRQIVNNERSGVEQNKALQVLSKIKQKV